MPPRYDLEIKSRLVLGLALLSLVVVLLLRLLLPVLLIAGIGAGGYWLWQQWQQQQRRRQRQQAQLNAKFYQLLQRQQGRISVLDFAMFAKIEGVAAQSYLNAQAQAFSAYFETTLQGDIIYVFNLAAVRGESERSPRPTPPVAPVAPWTYAEQVSAERARAEKAQTAWANAKQLRTLRQLSQRDLKRNAAGQTGQNGVLAPKVQADAAQSPTIRGRANEAPDGIVTIDVPAVRG